MIVKISRCSRPLLVLISIVVTLLTVMVLEVSNEWVNHKIVLPLHGNLSISNYYFYVSFSILITSILLGAYIGYQLPPKMDKTLFEKISWGILYAILTTLIVLPCVGFIYLNIYGE